MERWGFARLAWCLASDAERLTQSQSDSFRFIQMCSAPLGPTQIHSDSPRCKQILAISHRFAQLNAVSHRFAQIHRISHILIQIHLISLKHVQIHSAALKPTQIHSVLLQILSDPRDSFRFAQIHSDLLRLAQTSSN